MRLEEAIDEIKLELTGYVLELEIEDDTIKQAINKSLRELDRYWDESALITVPYSSCIDYTGTPLEDSSSIVKIYRNIAYGSADMNVMMDPAFAQQWALFSNNGTMYSLNEYVMNYAAWSTVSQIRNTLSTDLSFIEDKHDHKLYINNTVNNLSSITIEYIPKLHDIEDIKSDYWVDILIKLSTAYVKIILGRIRSRFSQSNALWGMDGDKLLDEGTTDRKELLETLRENSNLIFGID